MLGTSMGPRAAGTAIGPALPALPRRAFLQRLRAPGCQSIKELEGLFKPDQSLPLPFSGWRLGCLFNQVRHSSQRSSPGT